MKRALISCLLCERSFECDEKISVIENAKKLNMREVKIIDLNGKEEVSFFVCEKCANILANLDQKEFKILREKRKLPHVYVPKPFKKFAIINLS